MGVHSQAKILVQRDDFDALIEGAKQGMSPEEWEYAEDMMLVTEAAGDLVCADFSMKWRIGIADAFETVLRRFENEGIPFQYFILTDEDGVECERWEGMGSPERGLLDDFAQILHFGIELG